MQAFYLSLRIIKLISVLHVSNDYRIILHSDFLSIRSDCMVLCELNQHDYIYLIQLLNEKYINTTDSCEQQQINSIYKQLKFKSESWLNRIK